MIQHVPQPHEFNKRILLVVIGMTPQIVTETLYRLVVTSEAPFVPTEVHIITTKEGAESAANALLGVVPSGGWLDKFKEDFNLPAIEFSREFIHVIADTEGGFLNDSQSSEHNRVASDYITKTIHQMCSMSDCAVHVSLAGGRKTMSFYAGYALSLYGRIQDRLSHVLVNMPFQNNRDFFYPRPIPEQIEVGNQYYSTAEAQIILSDIPFVRMRSHFPKSLLNGTAGFQETVNKIEQFAQPPHVRFNSMEKIVFFNGLPIQFSSADYSFYYWMCKRCIDGELPLCPDADEFMTEFLSIYAEHAGQDSGHFEKVENIALKGNLKRQKAWFQTRNSTVKSNIIDELGERHASPFLVKSDASKNSRSYFVDLDRKLVSMGSS